MNNIEQYLFPGRNIKQEWDTRITSKKIPGIIETSLRYDHTLLKTAMEMVLTSHAAKNNDIYENDVILDCLGVKGKLPETYYTYILTKPTTQAIELQKRIDKEKNENWKERQRKQSRKTLLKSVITLNDDYDPLVDERNFTHLKEELYNTYFEEILKMFSAKVARTRISTLNPGEAVTAHVDANAKYVLRAHIPITTNDESYSYYFENGEEKRIHMKPGFIYILNPGVPHGAINNGTTSRVHLVVGLDGQEDILPYIKDKL